MEVRVSKLLLSEVVNEAEFVSTSKVFGTKIRKNVDSGHRELDEVRKRMAELDTMI